MNGSINPGIAPPAGGPTPQPQPQPAPQQPPNPTVNQAPQLATTPTVVPAWKTIRNGIIACAVLTLCLVGLLSGLVGTGWFAWILCGIVAFGGLGVYGVVPVEIQRTAVPLFFGQRINSFILREGWNWLPPSPIMSVVIVDMRERVLRIGEKFGQEKIEELVAATIQTPEETADNPDPHGNVRLVEMISRITIMWIVMNPNRFINVGETTIEGALTDLAVKTFRAEASKISDIDLIRSTDAFEKHVLGALVDDEDVTTHEKMTDIYGIRIRRVIIPKVTHRDHKTVESYESVAKEKRQKQAEEIERTFLIETIAALKNSGLNPEQAVLAIQAERNKSRRQELIIRTDKGVGDLTAAAAVLQQGGGLFTPPIPTASQGEGLAPDAPP